MKYHSKVNVIDILTCIYVINLNECCSFKSVISVVDIHTLCSTVTLNFQELALETMMWGFFVLFCFVE